MIAASQSKVDRASIQDLPQRVVEGLRHACHIKPHQQGGSNKPSNLKWENGKDNIARGGKEMTCYLKQGMRSKVT